MDTIQLLSKALLDMDRVEQTAGPNDVAYRRQSRIILTRPDVQKAVAHALLTPGMPVKKKDNRIIQ